MSGGGFNVRMLDPNYRGRIDQVLLNALGAMVREARSELRWSQMKLEGICGVDQTTISRMERGKLHKMQMRTLVRILGGVGLLPLPPEAMSELWLTIPKGWPVGLDDLRPYPPPGNWLETGPIRSVPAGCPAAAGCPLVRRNR